MFKNKFNDLVNHILILTVMISVGVLFSNSFLFKVTNHLYLDQGSLLADKGATFNPPDDGKPDPVNTAGYS